MRIASVALTALAAFTVACASNPTPATAPQPTPAAAPTTTPPRTTSPAPAPAPRPAPAPAPAAASAPAAAPATAGAVDMSGSWAVSLDIQGQTMAVDVTLARGPNGYTGEAAPQGQPGAPLSSLSLVGDRLTLTFGAPDGDAVFDGTLSPDRRAVAGTLTYQGQSLPFTMTKR